MSDSASRRPGRTAQLLAALGAVLPMAGLFYWMYLSGSGPMTARAMLAGPVVGGGAMIFWLLLLHLVVCRDRLGSIGFRPRGVRRDVAAGVVLAIGLLALHMGFQATLARLLPRRPPVPEIIELIHGISRDPVLLSVWLGPVVWIGVAGFEELWKAFLLRRAWNVWSGPVGRWSAVAAVALLFGLGHAYQGTAAVVSIAIQAGLMGALFMATGRIIPLIVAHALYDTVQVVMAVIAIRAALG